MDLPVRQNCPYHDIEEIFLNSESMELHNIASALEKWLPEIVSALRKEK